MKKVANIIFSTCILVSAVNAQTTYDFEKTSDNETFSGSDVYFNAGWTSTNDTITPTTLYLQNKSGTTDNYYPVTNYKISNALSFNVDELYVQGNSNVIVESSTVNINKNISVGGNSETSSLLFKNSNVTLKAMSSNSTISYGGSLAFEGGSFTIDSESNNRLVVKQGSTLSFKDTKLYLKSAHIETATDPSYKDSSARITIDNCTGNIGYIRMYGYESAGSAPVLNISNGSNVSLSLYKEEENSFFHRTDIYGAHGIINVSADSTLKLTDNLVQEEGDKSATINIEGTLKVDGKIELDKVVVGEKSSVSANSIKAETLTIEEGATLAVSDTVDFSNLNIILASEEAWEKGSNVNLSEILGDSSSIVLAGITEEKAITLTDASGKSYECKFDSTNSVNGNIFVEVIPEPSTYAIIFGALAFAFVAYRRHK